MDGCCKKADFNRLAKEFSISPVLARIMVNRGIKTDDEFRQYLYGNLDSLHDGHKMKDMDRGCRLLCKAIDEGQLICIASDFDVDGVFPDIFCGGASVRQEAGPM